MAVLEIADASVSTKNAASRLKRGRQQAGPEAADAGRNQHRRHEIKKDRVVVENRRQQGSRRQRQRNGGRGDAIAQNPAPLGRPDSFRFTMISDI